MSRAGYAPPAVSRAGYAPPAVSRAGYAPPAVSRASVANPANHLTRYDFDFGDNSGFHCDPQPLVNPGYCPKQYGPWTPPAKNDGKLTNSMWDHTYATPGTYHVIFDVRSAMQECNNPYASTAQLTADIVVT